MSMSIAMAITPRREPSNQQIFSTKFYGWRLYILNEMDQFSMACLWPNLTVQVNSIANRNCNYITISTFVVAIHSWHCTWFNLISFHFILSYFIILFFFILSYFTLFYLFHFSSLPLLCFACAHCAFAENFFSDPLVFTCPPHSWGSLYRAALFHLPSWCIDCVCNWLSLDPINFDLIWFDLAWFLPVVWTPSASTTTPSVLYHAWRGMATLLSLGILICRTAYTCAGPVLSCPTSLIRCSSIP